MALRDGLHDEDEGILIAPLVYVCRICEAEQTVYVQVEEKDGTPHIDMHNVRITTQYCEECGQRRVHVSLDAVDHLDGGAYNG